MHRSSDIPNVRNYEYVSGFAVPTLQSYATFLLCIGFWRVTSLKIGVVKGLRTGKVVDWKSDDCIYMKLKGDQGCDDREG